MIAVTDSLGRTLLTVPHDVNRFPDGTLALDAIPYIDDFLFYRINWFYEGDDELFTLMCLKNVGHKQTIFELFMPYLPHARMDRVDDPKRLFTLKTFCNIINDMNFSKVISVDVHSHVSKALLNNFLNCLPRVYIDEAIKDMPTSPYILFFPDEGAMKRYAPLFPNTPYTFGIKSRINGEVKELRLAEPELVSGKNVLIVDDICSKGGTFLHAAKALKKAGAADIRLYATHCENTVYQGEMYSGPLVTKIYTTDSLQRDEDYLNKIKVVKSFKEDIEYVR